MDDYFDAKQSNEVERLASVTKKQRKRGFHIDPAGRYHCNRPRYVRVNGDHVIAFYVLEKRIGRLHYLAGGIGFK